MPALTPAAGETPRCPACGAALVAGPLGPQCLRCTFAFAAEEFDDGMNQVSALFPELRILERIARGGFATVYRAEHRRMQRPVALKFLDTQLARSPEAVAMFEREMIHAGAQDHAGIVRAYDAGEREGHWFILMELIDGLDIGALVRRHGRLPVVESCELIRQAALALHYAHGLGLVHRDVKPGNLMVTRTQPVVKVLDFGLANLAVAPLYAEHDEQFLGTLEYVAPEQIDAPNRVDARADVYALGATLRRMLTGEPLRVRGGSEHSLFLQMKAITSEPAAPIGGLRPDLPPELQRVCDSLVSLTPAGRPPTALKVAQLLEPWCAGADLAVLLGEGPLEEKPFRPQRKGLTLLRPARLLIGALVLLLSLTAWAAWRARERAARDRPLPQLTAAPPVDGPWRLLLSPGTMSRRALEADIAPRLHSKAWELEGEILAADALHSPRFLPDGRLAYLHHNGDGNTLYARRLEEEDSRVLLPTWTEEELPYLAVSPEGSFAWSRVHDPAGTHVGRARPDGTPLPGLPYDFKGEFTALLAKGAGAVGLGEGSAKGYPKGLAAVFPGQVPENTGLAPGDLLIADEGHRPVVPGVEIAPGLWRGRFDTAAPATRLGALPGDRHLPIDVAISRHGVFLLNRSETIPGLPVTAADLDRRVYRWDRAGFHACTTDLPIYDPVALAADPASADLYAAQGGLIPSTALALQRLLRLRPVPGMGDRYTVEVVAERFGRMAPGGLAFSADGQRLAVCDFGNRLIVVLRRTGWAEK